MKQLWNNLKIDTSNIKLVLKYLTGKKMDPIQEKAMSSFVLSIAISAIVTVLAIFLGFISVAIYLDN